MLVTAASGLRAYDSSRWVIHTPTGRHVLVNEGGAELYRILRAADTLPEAHQAFNQAFESALPSAAFEALVQARFGGQGILQHDVPAAEPVSYIRPSLQLLSARTAAWLAQPLVALYRPRVFWALLAGQAAFLGAVVATQQLPASSPAAYLGALPLVYASLLVHELGHVAACAAARVRHGAIGAGLYAYVLPVLFADVTNVWQASRVQRIVVNAGGIYAQLLVASASAGGYLVTRHPTLAAAAVAIMASAVWQLNPFARSDGYWLLSDLTNTPNLHAQATQALRVVFSRPHLLALLQGRARRPSAPQWLLGAYGLFNHVLLFVLATWMLSLHGWAIVELPQQLPQLIGQAWHEHQWPRPQQLLAFSFYAMWARYLVARWVLRVRPAATPATSSTLPGLSG